MKRVSNFSEIEMCEVEFVSFVHENGFSTFAYGEQIINIFHNPLNVVSFLYAFVNLIGREFIIVDPNMD